jgi:hypothetical protein
VKIEAADLFGVASFAGLEVGEMGKPTPTAEVIWMAWSCPAGFWPDVWGSTKRECEHYIIKYRNGIDDGCFPVRVRVEPVRRQKKGAER